MTHNDAVAAVRRTLWRQPSEFRKKTHIMVSDGDFIRFLREEKGAPPGATTIENVAFYAPGEFGRTTASPTSLHVPFGSPFEDEYFDNFNII